MGEATWKHYSARLNRKACCFLAVGFVWKAEEPLFFNGVELLDEETSVFR